MTVSIEDALRAFARDLRGTVVLAAVSGGPDSMALADGLWRLAGHENFTLEIAHFNHLWRTDSTLDEDLVRSWCAGKALSFFVGRDEGRLSHHRPGSEAAARESRYAFLERIASSRDARWIVTAHTRDDQAETVLMQRAHGCGLRGEAGMAPRRGRIARPLLRVPRRATRSWCIRHAVPFRDDPTNTDLRWTRNRIRHVDIPALRRGDPRAVDHLVWGAERARRSLDAIRRKTNPLLAGAFERDGDYHVIRVIALRELSPVECQVLFADALDAFLAPGARASRRHFDALYRMSRADHRVGDRVSLPGTDVRREHDALVFLPHTYRDPAAAETVLTIPGTARFADTVEIDATTTSVGAQRPELGGCSIGQYGGIPATGVAYLDLEALTLPLVVRSPRPGDRIQPLGLSGTKKLSDLLGEHRVPRRMRCRVPVVTDAGAIVWVAGLATGHDVRVRETTRTLVTLTARTVSRTITPKDAGRCRE